LIDGLTKNFRYPGWRVCWVIGPKNLISALSQSGMLTRWSRVIGIGSRIAQIAIRLVP